MANRRRIARASMEPSVETEIGITVVPSLEQSKGWNKLSSVEQDAVRSETNEVQKAKQLEAQSKLAIGEHLSKIQDILGPKRLFVSFVDHNFGWSRATAYRYIDLYKIGRKMVDSGALSREIFEVAIERGTPINEEVIRVLPPPKVINPDTVRQYMEAVEAQPSPAREIVTDYDTLLKEAFNFVVLRESRLVGNQRMKNNWHNDLIGMLLTKWGIASQTMFRPIAIPETMISTRGRPKTLAA